MEVVPDSPFGIPVRSGGSTICFSRVDDAALGGNDAERRGIEWAAYLGKQF
jgi:hypothetical protein